jgi:hypothetical protein
MDQVGEPITGVRVGACARAAVARTREPMDHRGLAALARSLLQRVT